MMKTTMKNPMNNTGNVFQMNMLATRTGLTGQPHTHLQTNLYATNGSLIKEFISKKEHFLDESTERRTSFVNRYGFIAGLIDGFNSDGNKRLEITLPDSADLSISQNGGFSVFFWFLCKKQSGGIHRFIIKRGNTLD